MKKKPTLVEAAQQGIELPVFEAVSLNERLDKSILIDCVASGKIVIPKNAERTMSRVCGIGKGLRTKVNVNLGTSQDKCDISHELQKLEVAIKHKGDTVMDLSTGGDIAKIRETLLKHSSIPFGTVPVYQAMAQTGNDPALLKPDELFRVIEEQMAGGVDFVTVHCGVTRDVVHSLMKSGRMMGVVSRGGAFTVHWMDITGNENPLYDQYDRLVELAHTYDVTLSLGDGLRPGCISDATDVPQIKELTLLAELAGYAHDNGVQVMIEGPGHVPLDQVAENITIQQHLCKGFPFYVLGPLVTDVAAGYDHISAAIGGAVAAMYGADFLCFLTPAEHLGLPDINDVREGLIAARIAAHAGDVAKGIPGAREWDDAMSRARFKRDWETQIRLALDPEKARSIHERLQSSNSDVCTMCGDYCSMKITEKIYNGHRRTSS